MHTLYVKGKVVDKSEDLHEMMELEWDIVGNNEATHEECEIVSDNFKFINPARK